MDDITTYSERAGYAPVEQGILRISIKKGEVEGVEGIIL
jgi:hypothetical protein